jgi:hypothetical protein
MSAIVAEFTSCGLNTFTHFIITLIDEVTECIFKNASFFGNSVYLPIFLCKLSFRSPITLRAVPLVYLCRKMQTRLVQSIPY